MSWVRITTGFATAAVLWVTVGYFLTDGANLARLQLSLAQAIVMYYAVAVFVAAMLFVGHPRVHTRLGGALLGFVIALPAVMAFAGLIYPDPLTPRQFIAGSIMSSVAVGFVIGGILWNPERR